MLRSRPFIVFIRCGTKYRFVFVTPVTFEMKTPDNRVKPTRETYDPTIKDEGEDGVEKFSEPEKKKKKKNSKTETKDDSLPIRQGLSIEGYWVKIRQPCTRT